MTTIFISYSHKDTAWREELESYLRILALNDERVGLETWSDQELQAGDEWRTKIRAIMERASLAVLIVTKNFLSSEFISRKELPYLLERARSDDLRIVPVLAESCPWEEVPALESMQLYPSGDRPLAALASNDQNVALTKLLRQIREMVSLASPTLPPGPGPDDAATTSEDPSIRTLPIPIMGEGTTLQVSLRHHRAAQYYFARIRYRDPGSGKHERAERALSYTAHLGPASIGSCGPDLGAYASELERRIFPPGPVRELLRKALERAAGRPLTLRISIDPTASDLHELDWETLTAAPAFAERRNVDCIFTRYVSPGEEIWPKAHIRSRPGKVGVVLVDRRLEARSVEHEAYARAFEGLGLECTRLGGDAPLASADAADAAIALVATDLTPDRFAIRVSWSEGGGQAAVSPAEEALASLRRHLGGAQILILDTRGATGDADELAAHRRATLCLAADVAATGFCAVITCAASLGAAAWQRFLELFLTALHRTGNVDVAAQEARAAMPTEDAWKPAVFTRLRTGQIWLQPAFVGNGGNSWDLVVDRVREGTVVPILGPGLSEYLVRSRAEIAEQMAEQSHFPLARSERSKLREVAQYVATTQETRQVIRQFLSAVRTYTTERYGKSVEGLSDDGALEDNLELLWHEVLAQRADDPYRLLARLQAPVYLTTALHPFLSLAIGDQLQAEGGARPRIRDRILSLDQGILGAEEDCEELGLELEPAKPLVYYLFGRVDHQRSLVLTQDDHFRFLLNFKEIWRSLPEAVTESFSDSALLFLGFDLNSWDFRSIFRAFLELEGSNQLRKIPHVAVQVSPDDDRLADPERTRDYMVEYFKQISEKPLVFLGSAHDFLSKLDERCKR